MVRFEDNWADEMDIKGYEVMTPQQLEYVSERVKTYFIDNNLLKYYFGTNEYIEYSSAEEVCSKYTVQDISETDYNTLNSLNLLKFGNIGPF